MLLTQLEGQLEVSFARLIEGHPANKYVNQYNYR